jgi:hypothetical protein
MIVTSDARWNKIKKCKTKIIKLESKLLKQLMKLKRLEK